MRVVLFDAEDSENEVRALFRSSRTVMPPLTLPATPCLEPIFTFFFA